MKYELHTHTIYSNCSNLNPKVLLTLLKKKQFNGVAVTDHNKISGALAVKKLNRNKDFDVIIGEEIDTDKGQLLAYYVNKEIKRGKFYSVLDEIKSQGALVIAPHPFAFPRSQLRIPVEKLRRRLDGIEVINSRAFLFQNSMADRAAEKNFMAKIAGTDSHYAFEVGRAATYFDDKYSLREALKHKKTIAQGSVLYGNFGAAIGVISSMPRWIQKNILERKK